MFWIMTVSAVILSQSFEALSYGQAPQLESSSEIDRIHLEDQQARQPPNPNAPKPVYRSDDERETATRRLLQTGDLKNGKDFEKGAVIFQHSHQSDDYLLAHTLDMVAV